MHLPELIESLVTDIAGGILGSGGSQIPLRVLQEMTPAASFPTLAIDPMKRRRGEAWGNFFLLGDGGKEKDFPGFLLHEPALLQHAQINFVEPELQAQRVMVDLIDDLDVRQTFAI